MPKETKNIPTKILQDLTKALWALNKSRAIRIYNNPWKLLWYNFLIGVTRGLGSIIGATLVLGIIVYILSKFLYVPVLGDIINVIFSLSKGSTN